MNTHTSTNRRFLSLRGRIVAGLTLIFLAGSSLLPQAAGAATAPVHLTVHPSPNRVRHNARYWREYRQTAQVHIAVTQAPGMATPAGSIFTYRLQLDNKGPSTAYGTWADLALDPHVQVVDFKGSDGTIFVDSLTPGSIHVRFHQVSVGDTPWAQVMVQVRPTAQLGALVAARAEAHWSDIRAGESNLSNLIGLRVGSAADNGRGGLLGAFSNTTSTDVTAGSSIDMSTAVFGGDEPVSFWLNQPDGTVKAIDALGHSDRAGALTVTLDTTGLAPGHYSLVAQGWETAQEGIQAFTVR